MNLAIRGDRASRLGADALLFCLVLIGYVVGATLAWRLLAVAELGAVFFAPAGLTAAALLLVERSRWPIVVVAAALAEVIANVQNGIEGPLALAGFALANTAEPVVGALIATHRKRRLDLRLRSDLVWFFIGAVLIAPVVGAVVGAGTVRLGGGPFTAIMFSWWLGDSLGVLVVGGLILTAVTASDRRVLLSAEAIVLLGMATTFGIFLHWITDMPIGFLAVVPLTAISARLGSLAGAVTTILVVVVAVTSWFPNDGTVAGIANADGILIVKLQLWAMAAAALLVAAESSERQIASEIAGTQLRATEVLRAALAPDPVITSRNAVAEGVSRSADARLEVGGDWYDIVEMPDGRIAIMIGDVAGHGEEALIMMGKLRFATSALAMRAQTPGQLMDEVDLFAQAISDQPYATAFFAMFDPVKKELMYSTAGHPPGLLGTPNGTWQWLFSGRSTPIGLTFPQPRPSATVQLDGPTTLVIYTDGVVERAGEVIDAGLARVFDAVVSGPERSVDELVDSVTARVTSDDVSFVRIHLDC